MNQKFSLICLLFVVFIVLLVACGGENQITDTLTPKTKVVDKVEVENRDKRAEIFWNEGMTDLPKCTTDFKFTHQFADPKDVLQIMFGPGGHIAPHEHMVYWEAAQVEDFEPISGEKRQVSERIQLYAPTDIYRVRAEKTNRISEEGDTYVEWGAWLYACNGHQLMLGHIGEPSDVMQVILAKTESTCDVVSGYSAKGEVGCKWEIDTFIPAGTPIFKSSGYQGAFDFGLSLFGLTAEQLQEQPGNGYSITPWRVSSGNAVCPPLEYFTEPTRASYLKLLGNFTCGPFNQDVLGTAMGFWLSSPSPDTVPMTPFEREVDEWETIWLFQSQVDRSMHTLTIGNNTFGLDTGQYGYRFVSEGLVNVRWDFIKPGSTYCVELRTLIEHSVFSQQVETIMVIHLLDDGNSLTVEASNNNQCDDGPWQFQGGERTFFR